MLKKILFLAVFCVTIVGQIQSGTLVPGVPSPADMRVNTNRNYPRGIPNRQAAENYVAYSLPSGYYKVKQDDAPFTTWGVYKVGR